eukprot:scaffold79412_cov66-Phaeocystis_antarctica.AAC.10
MQGGPSRAHRPPDPGVALRAAEAVHCRRDLVPRAASRHKSASGSCGPCGRVRSVVAPRARLFDGSRGVGTPSKFCKEQHTKQTEPLNSRPAAALLPWP